MGVNSNEVFKSALEVLRVKVEMLGAGGRCFTCLGEILAENTNLIRGNYKL